MNWETIATFLESPVASMGYGLLVIFLLFAARAQLRNSPPVELSTPVATILGVLVSLRLVEVIIFGIAWLGSSVSVQLMPPLERGLHIITILALGWLWAQYVEQKKNRQGYFAFALIAVLVITIGIIVLWLLSPQPSFNYTYLDYLWTGACVAALYLGWFHIFTGRRNGQGAEGWRSFIRWKTNGAIVFFVFLAGQLIHLMLAEPFGNMPLATELATLLALPILFRLTPTSTTAETATGLSSVEAQPTPSEPKFDEFSDTFHADAANLARTLAEDYEADACAFLHMQERQDHLTLEVGYNLLRDVSIEPSMIESNQVPKLWQSLEEGRLLRLSAGGYLPELGILAQSMRISFHANLLAAPLAGVSSISMWGIVLLRGKEPWHVEDEVELEKQSAEISQVLATFAGAIPEHQQEVISETQSSDFASGALVEAENSANGSELKQENLDWLFAEESSLDEHSPVGLESSQAENVFDELQKESGNLVNALYTMGTNRGDLGSANSEVQQAKEELRLALEEVAVLHAKLEAAQKVAPVEPVKTQLSGKKMAGDQAEVVADIAQELRQPLSSVLGYTELLLSESVGLLGALQRKFLERVEASTERMNSLIGDLIHIAEMEQSGHGAVRKSVDLGVVIEDAISQLRPQMEKKNTKVHVDLPKRIAELNADRDALQQIIFHLLQNANAATPVDGAITIRAATDAQPEYGDFILVQVTDSGGGIPNEYLPGLFSRVYRATNPIIPGVGDTGVGLTIAETLAKALGGRIWVDSEMGKGATFSVLLPLTGRIAGEAANVTKTLNEI